MRKFALFNGNRAKVLSAGASYSDGSFMGFTQQAHPHLPASRNSWARIPALFSAVVLIASCDVIDPVGDYRLDLKGSEFDLSVGEVRSADANLLLNGITIDEKIEFSSSARGVVSVDSEGVIVAVGQGRATVRASARGQSDSIFVNVGPGSANSIATFPASVAFDALTATASPSVQALNQFGAAIPHSAPTQWEALNESVATVSPTGLITAVGAGTTKIRVTSGDFNFELPVQVNQVVTSLAIVGGVPRVFRGERAKLEALARDRMGITVEPVTLAWSSQNEAVATVDEDGWILGKSTGATVISVALVAPNSAPGGFPSGASPSLVSAVVPITVEASRFQSVLMSPDSTTVYKGETLPINVTLVNSNGGVVESESEVAWSSTDHSVATVNSNGVVTAINAGYAEIVATVEGITGVTFLHVLPPVEVPELALMAVTPSSATFMASPFAAHPGAGHLVSEWQVAPIGSGFTNLIVTSGETGVALTSYGVIGLSPSTTYEARVRYRDSDGNWSSWSGGLGFTTPSAGNAPPNTPAVASVTGIAQTSVTLNGSAFVDPDAASTHQASQWQVDLSNRSFLNPVVNSGETNSSLTSFAVSGLNASTGYRARVRYRDNSGNWSSWSVAVSFTTSATSNAPPNTPTIASVTSIAQTTATLNGSLFSDPNAGNTHQSSEWQVDLSGGSFTNPVVSSGETTVSRTSYGVTGLSASTAYRARVRYRDNTGNWSAWSSTFSFTTAATPSSSPNTPTVASVSAIAATTATLNGSAFSDPNAGDSHLSSQWQVTLSGGSFTSPTVNSGETGAALTSYNVSGLTGATGYRARVRYRDSAGNWSSWSTSFSFTTAAPSNTAPNTPSVGSVTSITGTTATLNGSSFSDPDAGNTHQASQWQIDLSGGSFATPVVNSGETTTSLTSYSASGLAASTAYRARVRYRDNNGNWSSWATPFNFTTGAAANAAPNTPTVTSATSITATGAALNGSAFSDPDAGNFHQSSQWQVILNGGTFTSPLRDSGETNSSLTSYSVTGLTAATVYRARVRYRDNGGSWSSWGTSYSFTTGTTTTNSAPNTPSVNTVTSITASGATVNASAFSDPDAGNTHQSSQWQIVASGGSFTSPLIDSGETTTSRTSYTTSGLSASTGYQARVRYRDSVGSWSSWSSSLSFTTAAASGGGGGGTGGVVLQTNWSTATGTTTTALSDGGRMGSFGSGSVLSVVSGSSLGWTRTPNVLQVSNRGEESYGFVSNTLALPTGTREYFIRMYVRLDGAQNGMTFHSVKLGFQTLDAAFWGIERPTSTTYQPRLKFANHSGLASYGYSASNLQQGQWYRFEYRVDFYDSANPLRVRIWPYVYDMAGNLVAGPDTWADVDNRSRTVSAAYAAGGYATFSSQSAIRDFFLGYEGTSGNSDTSARWYYAGVEVRTDRFPGPIE